MATSARTASLKYQRNPYGTMRVLAPRSTGISTIAKTTAKAELNIMVDRYNDGLVTNADMKAFLQKQLTNPGMTQSDIVDIQDKLRDFDTLIRKDRLEAIFKAAPEYSLEQIEAAQSLSNFYKERAASMAPGTPAQSQVLENQAIWDQKIVDINNSVQKKQRQNQRYIEEQKVMQEPAGTSERAASYSQMFQKLADQALTDGDTIDYNKYLTYAQQYQTQAEQLAQKEQTQANKATINEYIAQEQTKISSMKNNSAEQVAAKAELYNNVAQYYADAGDQINYSRYISMFNDAKQDYEKKVSASATTSIKSEINAGLAELRQIESAYKYGKPLIQSDGTSGYVSGQDLANIKTQAYQQIIEVVNYGIENGVTGLEDDLRRYSDLLDQATFLKEKYDNGEYIDVVGPNGQVKSVDASYPEVRDKYVQGEKMITAKNEQGQESQVNKAPYYQLLSPKSNITGGVLTNQELQQAYEQGRAYKTVDDYGNEQYVSERYVDVPTESGVERIWTQHDSSTGQLLGYISEKSEVMGNKPQEGQQSYMPYIKTVGQLPQNVMTEEQFRTKLETATKSKPPTQVDATMVAPIEPVKDQSQVQTQDPLRNISNVIKQAPIQYVAQKVADYVAPKVETPTVQPSGSGFSFSNQPNVTYTPTQAPSVDINKAISSGGLTTTPTTTAPKTYANTITVNNTKKVKQYDAKTGQFYYI